MPEYTYTFKLSFFRQKGKPNWLINKTLLTALGQKYFIRRSTSAMHCFQVGFLFGLFVVLVVVLVGFFVLFQFV